MKKRYRIAFNGIAYYQNWHSETPQYYTFHDRNYVVLQNTLRLARCQQDIRPLRDQR